MLVSLTPHPDTPSTAVDRIEVHLERREERLWLRFIVHGAVDRVVWPEPVGADRTDELWKHTCFEAFVPTHDGYREFNMSPSGQWASYHFEGYRSGMAAADEIIDVAMLDGAGDWRAVEAEFDLPPKAFFIGLAAVIEDVDGGISYWALAIPPGKPDFHHTDSFALALPTLELS
ncbi:DOMON-like domain-containing protein [Brevundimonas lenta]|uniref:DOMON-like domain-containing protein n=1 Tax=Brevundimonas lenta TaxID=424796 RepID=A0A7W6JCR5_9CAUL|nr:DOMON-like domain-containing protein [Brevundimonas lenta]MBB4082746.1 hypothetical protein [Brevundimonas lenta]